MREKKILNNEEEYKEFFWKILTLRYIVNVPLYHYNSHFAALSNIVTQKKYIFFVLGS